MSEVVIDSHVHVLPPRRQRGLVRWLKRAYPQHPVSEDITADEIVSDLRAAGVTHFFNLAYPLAASETDELNDFNFEFCERTPGAVPFASLHPETPDKVKVGERALARGFIGFKFHPFVQGFDPWDARLDRFYGLMQEARRPVLLHTGFELFYGKPMPSSRLIELVKRYPRLPFVFVHMAFPDLAAMFELMADYPDLYLDATNVVSCFHERYRAMLEVFGSSGVSFETMRDGLERFPGRTLFGTDHPAGMGSYAEVWSDLAGAPLSAEVRAMLRGGAARGLIERLVPGFDWGRSLQESAG
jgi:predicted TIM-barrel fold metal-dependent hydrolase